MKPVFSAAIVLALAAGAAQAQSNPNDDKDHGARKPPAAAPAHPNVTPPRAGVRTGPPGVTPGVPHGQAGPQFTPRGGNPGFNPAVRGGTGFVRNPNQPGMRGAPNLGPRVVRPTDQGRPRFDPNRYRRSYTATRRFHVGAYYQPRGWYYRQWGFGDILPFGWFAANYYLNAFDYGLPPPPMGAEWVRNGPDALLVDIWTGEVLSVEYGVFY